MKTRSHIQVGLLIATLFTGSFMSDITLADVKLNDAGDRITDQAIKADQANYTATQARIAALNNTGKIPVANYNLSKAQCWLDVSLHEYTRNDRSDFPQQSLEQADLILTALEKNIKPNPAEKTPLVNDADKLRDDLWAKTNALKSGKGFTCYAQKVACAEVELVHAGNENKQQGWRHAKPYVQIAEDLVSDAEATGDRCLPPPPPPIPAPIPVPELEHITLGADALFEFDKSATENLLPAGKATLDELASKLKTKYIQINHIAVTGYTDRLGATEYNQRLSERRATTVKQYLQSRGVDYVIEAFGKGKANQVEACGQSTKHTRELIQCLQPNRRVTIDITGIKSK